MAECWSCGAEKRGASFCPTCEKIQPLSPSATYFDALGLPKRMRLEAAVIDRAFREASKKVHPDLYTQSSPTERKNAVEHTAFLNEAYRTLRDPQRRAEYLMGLQGVHVGREENTLTDPELLMEMLEHQEKVEFEKSRDALESLNDQMIAREKDRLESLTLYFDEGSGTKEAALSRLYELRFLERLLERIDNKLEELV